MACYRTGGARKILQNKFIISQRPFYYVKNEIQKNPGKAVFFVLTTGKIGVRINQKVEP